MSARKCHACGEAWISEARNPSRTETCEKCHAYLHSCLNCQEYSPGAPNECREPNVEFVADKIRANFCDYFVFAQSSGTETGSQSQPDAKQAFDDLFKS